MSDSFSNPNYGMGVGGWGSGRYGNSPIEYQPLGYYLTLITSQYQGATNFMRWLQATLQFLDDISICLTTFITEFDIDAADGIQLDILGQIIGQNRTVGFEPSNGVSPTLDDNTYQVLLKSCIARNQWDGTINGLQNVWQGLFPGGRITIDDSQNMTATLILSGGFSSIIQDLVTNGYIVPRPQGVLYAYTFPLLPALGFDANNAYIAGFDKGYFT